MLKNDAECTKVIPFETCIQDAPFSLIVQDVTDYIRLEEITGAGPCKSFAYDRLKSTFLGKFLLPCLSLGISIPDP